MKINYVRTKDSVEQKVGNSFEVEASIFLNNLSPDDVSVEIYNGMLDAERNFASGQPIPMAYSGTESASHVFRCQVPCVTSGLHGYNVRILPKNPALYNPYELCLIKWEA
jgi:starch phosphorylase